MRHQMKWLTAIALCAGMALPASPAQAKDPGPNGQIAFSRVIEDDNTVTCTANPDGSHLHQLFPGFSTALRLAKAFGTSPQFWLNGQLALDLYKASHDEEELRQLERIEPVAR
jgi:hypothetical protein